MSEAMNREYHEKSGWRFESDEHWHAPECTAHFNSLSDYRGIRFAGECVGVCRSGLPPLHASADLCIAELDRVFQDWYVRVEHIDDPASEFHGKKTILVTGENFNREKDDWEPSCSGHSIGNFCEAALKCLIAAHKRESEAQAGE